MKVHLNRPHKRAELTIKISSNRQSTINGGEQFFTMDAGGTAVGIFNFEIEDENKEFKKLDLTDVKKILIGFHFENAGSSMLLEPEELDAENGSVALVLPNQFEYSGIVHGYTYIIWEDRELDGGGFQLTFNESRLDKELPEMDDFYVQRFEDLAKEIRRRVEEIKNEMNSELETVKQDLATAQSDADRIQDQINANDIITQNDLATHVTDDARHILPNERATWDNRMTQNELATTGNARALTDHAEDGSRHLTAGNAGTATRLLTARPFRLTGVVEGSADSDLASGVTINTQPRRLQVFNWEGVEPASLGLRNGDAIRVYGLGTATNQPLGTSNNVWVGTLRCVLSTRFVLTVTTDVSRQVTREWNSGAWMPWQDANESALRLRTPRQINGVNFDGSANITTANWGTSRNITIGNTTRSVNGSQNIVWSLEDVGAAALMHNHAISQVTDLQNQLNNRVLTSALSSAGVSNFSGRFRAGDLLIQTGRVSIPGGSGQHSSATITFPQIYASAPNIQVTADTGVSGTVLLGLSAMNVNSINFQINTYRTNATSTNVFWLAVGAAGVEEG